MTTPTLTFSTVLTDEDLVEIVQSQGEEKRKAIASRPRVSPNVSKALIDIKNEAVVGTLVANDSAEISTGSMHRVLDDFADSDFVKSSMVGRSALPVEVSKRLVNMVSDKLLQDLVARHELPADSVSDLILQSREKAMLGFLDGKNHAEDSRRLIINLYQNNRLTPIMMLRDLCMGDMDFFEGYIAVHARTPLLSASELIHGRDRQQITFLLDKAELPKLLQPAFEVPIDVAEDTDYDGGKDNQDRFRRRMVERIITNFDDPDAAMGDDNIEYLLAQLTQIDAGFAAAY